MNEYINLTIENLNKQHLCCAISTKMHEAGVEAKKEWLKAQLKNGHVFRKLNAQGKVFIEYCDLEKAYVPIQGHDFLYIYCLWVAGSYKGHGYGDELLTYAINDAKARGKKGICTLSSKKKKPFLADKKFFEHYGFKVVDTIGDYELLALTFDKEIPHFCPNASKMTIDDQTFTIYYSPQCPYIINSINEILSYTTKSQIKINLIKVDTIEKAKEVPCVFNNWATFKDGKFVSNTILNENSFVKLINE